MPQGKGTYGSKRGRPPKKKYQRGGRDWNPPTRTPDPIRRDTIFKDDRFITTNPETGLIEEGPDPLTPQQRIEQMAIINKQKDNPSFKEELERVFPPEPHITPKRVPMTPLVKERYKKKGRGGILAQGGAIKSSNMLKSGESTGGNSIL